MIHLDFESRSTVNIWDTGAYTYSMHPSTEIICCAFAHHNDFEARIVPDEPLSKKAKHNGLLLKYVLSDEIFSAYNSFFEFCMWQNIMVRRFGWPEIPLGRWRDTMAKVCAHALPRSLGNAGVAMHAPIQKSEEGRKIMLKVCKPRKPTKSNPDIWHEHPEDYKILYDYCLKDVEAERALDRMLLDLPPQEQKVWELDQKINWRGIQIDEDAVDAAIAVSEEYSLRLIDEIQNLTQGALDGVSRRKMVMDWIKSKGIDIPGYTKQDVIDLLNSDLPDDVRRVLEVRQQLGKTSIAKYKAMKASVSGGRIRDTLMYHGASTGRWAGKLVQMQNIPRGNVKDTETCIGALKTRDLDYFEMLYPDVMGAIASCIRGMLISGPGCDLIVADYASIEARVLVWLAGDLVTVEKFHKGVDLYVDMAQKIYNKEKISKNERQLGKTAILACGYGMGAAKFYATCKAWGITIEEDFAQAVINIYRERYRLVKQMWYDQERAAIRATQTGQQIACGKVSWKLHKQFLYCKLPSGRCLAYNEPKIQPVVTPWGETKEQLTFMATNATTKQWIRTSTYGGKLVENITQAVARDFMAEAMLRLEDAGYPVVLSVHDEILSEVPEGFGSIREFTDLMAHLPAWADNCPIMAEGWRGKRYKK